jgi:rhamnulokinase
MAEALARIPASEIYRRTGIQFQPFNTLYQLVATVAQEPTWIARARRLLLLPDYFHFRLCGVAANEYTNATTTQLWDIRADDWDDDLLALAGISRALLGRPVDPGTILGEMALASGHDGALKVIAPATHDTASSVAAIPLEDDDEVFLSSGTWSLMGIESRIPFTCDAARRLNITNEGGVERRYRVLKNITGLWIVERLRKELGVGHDHLVEAACAAAPWQSLIDPQDPRFFNPPSMGEAIAAFCAATGQPRPGTIGALARTVFESLALSYRIVAGELVSLRGRPVSRIRIVGGGSRNRFLNQLVPVRAGPVETSALGNACVQLVGLGVLPSLDAARALIRRSYPVEEYLPRTPVPDDSLQRFGALRSHPPTVQTTAWA